MIDIGHLADARRADRRRWHADLVIEVRRLTTADRDILRETRLRALADSPDAFNSTAKAEREQSPEDWDARLRATAFFVAFEGEHPVGLVGGQPDTATDWVLISMWVAPEARGFGLADRLVAAVYDAAAEWGARRVGLRVVAGNVRAQRAYERLGFVSDGDPLPLSWDPSRTRERMYLPVTTSTSKLR
jgi:GNAT superfamily N-acetyltransferase